MSFVYSGIFKNRAGSCCGRGFLRKISPKTRPYKVGRAQTNTLGPGDRRFTTVRDVHPLSPGPPLLPGETKRPDSE